MLSPVLNALVEALVPTPSITFRDVPRPGWQASHDRFTGLLEEISYKPGWEFRIGFADHTYEGGKEGHGAMYLQVLMQTADVRTGLNTQVHGRKHLLSTWMTNSEFVQTVLYACLQAEEHECREHFKYQNVQVFGPHHDTDKLVTLIQGQLLTEDKRP
jgi:hypothetical protein